MESALSHDTFLRDNDVRSEIKMDRANLTIGMGRRRGVDKMVQGDCARDDGGELESESDWEVVARTLLRKNGMRIHVAQVPTREPACSRRVGPAVLPGEDILVVRRRGRCDLAMVMWWLGVGWEKYMDK